MVGAPEGALGRFAAEIYVAENHANYSEAERLNRCFGVEPFDRNRISVMALPRGIVACSRILHASLTDFLQPSHVGYLISELELRRFGR